MVDEYGNPLPGVRLKVEGRKTFSLFAGESGLIVVELPPGKYHLTAKLKGFCSRRGEALVLPGIVNSYSLTLKLGVKTCPSGAKRLPSGEEFWPTEGFYSLETLPMSREVLRERSERFFVNHREFSRGHFPFSVMEPVPILGDYMAFSWDRGDVGEERPGGHSYFYSPPGFSLSLENLPSSLKSGKLLHKFTGFSLTSSYDFSRFRGSFSVFYLRGEREFPDQGIFSREAYSAYMDLGYGNWGVSSVLARRREPHQWAKARPWLEQNNIPSLSLNQRDFSLYYGKRLNSPFDFSIGIETKEAQEGEYNPSSTVFLSRGERAYFLHSKIRQRKYHLSFDGRLFFDRLAGAQHTIDYGGGIEYLTLNERRWSREPILKFSLQGGELYPSSGFYWWRIYPYGEEEQTGKFYHIFLKLQDTWNFSRLVLFTGIRYDNYHTGFNSGIKNGLSQWEFLNGEGNEDIFSRRLIYSFSGVSTEGFGIRLGFGYEISSGVYLQGGISRFAKPIDVEDMEIFYPLFQGWADVFWRDSDGDGYPSSGEVLSKTILPPTSPSQNYPTEYIDVVTLGLSGEVSGIFYGAEFWLENYSNRAGIVNTKLSSSELSSWWEKETIPEPGPDGVFGTSDDGSFTFYYFVPTEKVQEFSWAFSPYPVKDLAAVSRNFRLYLRKYPTGKFSFFAEAIYSQKRGYWGPSYPRIYSPNQLENLKSSFDQWSFLGEITLIPFNGLAISLLYRYRTGRPYHRWVYLITEKSPPFNLQRIILSPLGYERAEPLENLNLSLSYRWRGATLYIRVNNLLNSRVEFPMRGFQGLLTEDGQFFPSSGFSLPFREYGSRELVLGIRLNY